MDRQAYHGYKFLLASVAVGAALLFFALTHQLSTSTFPHIHYDGSHVVRYASARRNFTKRWQPCDWEAAAEAITVKPLSQLDKDCELPLNAGTNLDCMLTGTDADQWASKWTDESKIKDYGWEDRSGEYEPYDIAGMGLENFFEDLKISTDEEDWVNLFQQHSSASHDPKAGETYPATFSRYSNHFNIKQGVLLAADNTSPKGIKTKELTRSLHCHQSFPFPHYGIGRTWSFSPCRSTPSLLASLMI